MNRSKSIFATAILALSVVAAGCGTKTQPPAPVVQSQPAPVTPTAPGTPTATPVSQPFTVKVDGKTVSFTAKKEPHEHEKGSVYAPAAELGKALGVEVAFEEGTKTAKVNGKPVLVQAKDAKGVHDHDGVQFAPIKEFAAAAGYVADINFADFVVTITKK